MKSLSDKPWGWWVPIPDQQTLDRKAAANRAKQAKYMAKKKAADTTQ